MLKEFKFVSNTWINWRSMTKPICLCKTALISLSLIFVCIMKIQQTWILSGTFVFMLHQKRPVLVSTHAQNCCSWNAKKNPNCSAPKTVTRVTKVANKRFFLCLHLRGNASTGMLVFFVGILYIYTGCPKINDP